MKILIADDNNTDRLILEKILTQFGHKVVAATDGVEAVSFFKQYKPDIVLLDALMPNMDGYQASIEIKKLQVDKAIPIIFLTSLTDATALAHCLEVGGDDFLSKPYNKIILQAKLKAFERMMLLHDVVRKQRDEIQTFTKHMIHEQEVAKGVFDTIAHSANLEQPNIQYLLSPMSVFNGDLLLYAKAPSGSSHILLGDFTGHGLPAAIGTMPMAEIFFGMTSKGFLIADIMLEINTRLTNILPTGIFCCATACEINYRNNRMTIWAGGLPDAYIVRSGEGLVKTIISQHLPLGILKGSSFSAETDIFRLEYGDKLYIFSDGVLEAEAPNGAQFGEKKLLEHITTNTEQSGVFESLLTQINEFCQSEEQNDDLTLIEYTFDKTAYLKSGQEQTISNIKVRPLDWSLQYELRPETLKSFDPLPIVLQIFLECPGLKPYRGRVFTILAELYSNALDHGVLTMDSSMKESPDGFVDYYNQRKIKLDALDSGYIRIKMEHIPSENGGDLIIQVEDSGKGFDINYSEKSGNSFSGRGLNLVRSLCKTLDHLDNGRCTRALFQWQYT